MKDTTKNITMWLRPQECTEPSTDLGNYHSKQQPEMHHIENSYNQKYFVKKSCKSNCLTKQVWSHKIVPLSKNIMYLIC